MPDIIIVLASIAAVLAVYAALSPRFAELIYRPALFVPHKFPRGNWDNDWLQNRVLEDVIFEGAPGSQLHGWFFPAEGSSAVVLVHHGNTGNLGDLRVLIDLLLRAGVSVFAYDYRGYGKSGGAPSVAGVCQDAVAAHDWVVGRCPGQALISYGESLGAAVACHIAHTRRPQGLILQSGFAELRRIACETYPFFAIWPAAFFPRPYFNNAGALKALSCPLLVLHGAADTDVAPAHAQALFEAAPEPKQLVILPHTAHEEIAKEDAELVISSIRAFIARHVPSHNAGSSTSVAGNAR